MVATLYAAMFWKRASTVLTERAQEVVVDLDQVFLLQCPLPDKGNSLRQ